VFIDVFFIRHLQAPPFPPKFGKFRRPSSSRSHRSPGPQLRSVIQDCTPTFFPRCRGTSHPKFEYAVLQRLSSHVIMPFLSVFFLFPIYPFPSGRRINLPQRLELFIVFLPRLRRISSIPHWADSCSPLNVPPQFRSSRPLLLLFQTFRSRLRLLPATYGYKTRVLVLCWIGPRLSLLKCIVQVPIAFIRSSDIITIAIEMLARFAFLSRRDLK